LTTIPTKTARQICFNVRLTQPCCRVRCQCRTWTCNAAQMANPLTCIGICQLSLEGVQGSSCGGHASVGALQLLPSSLLPLSSPRSSRLRVIQASCQAGLCSCPGLCIGTGRRLQPPCKLVVEGLSALPAQCVLHLRLLPCLSAAMTACAYPEHASHETAQLSRNSVDGVLWVERTFCCQLASHVGSS
jgi:hypothetical protein